MKLISKKIWLLSMLATLSSLQAGIFDFWDKITVWNHTKRPVWVGVYRLDETLVGNSTGSAVLQGDLVSISPDGSARLDRSDFKIKTNREIIFSDISGILKNKLNAFEYRLATKTGIGVLNGSVFHIVDEDNVLHGYSAIGWSITKPLTSLIDDLLPSSDDEPRKPKGLDKLKTKAIIRRGQELAWQETDFLSERFPKVKKALEQSIDMHLASNEIPRIAICASGGGMRAATATLGLLEGLHNIGLIDGITYAAGLSGSSWTIASFVELGLPMDSYSQHFVTALSEKNYVSFRKIPSLFTKLLHVLRPKNIFAQRYGAIDLYGVSLANTFFHNIDTSFGAEDIRLSDSQRYLVEGSSFFPIYTAVQTEGELVNTATFTPYEFSIDNLSLSIPIWALGRKFKNGVTINFAPELSLGFLMGIWGSAMSGAFGELMRRMEATSLLPSTLAKLKNFFIETNLTEFKIAPINVCNPLYGVENSSIRNLQEISLIDSGYSYNLPLLPLLKKERKIDLIVVMDASASVHKNAPMFQEVIDMANDEGVLFEQIDFEKIANQPISIIKGKAGTKAPTILFIPPVKNEKIDPNFDPKDAFEKPTYDTTKFIYAAEDIKKLSGVLRQNIIDNKSLIFTTIKEIIEQKRRNVLWERPNKPGSNS